MVPLTTGAQPIDDGVEDGALVDPFAAPRGFGGSCSARIGSMSVHIASDAFQIVGSGGRIFFGRPMRIPPPVEGHAGFMPFQDRF